MYSKMPTEFFFQALDGQLISSVMVRVFIILYMTFGEVIEELCPSPLLFLCVVPFGMYLDDDEDISILSELASCFFFNQN